MEIDAEKTYVQVEAKFLVNGDVEPTCVIWEDGTRYFVESILDMRPGVSLLTRAAGMRYAICIGSRITYLYRTGTRWFVEPKKHCIQANEIPV